MKQLHLSFLFLLFAGLHTTAQTETQKIYFLKNSGVYVKDKDSADYTRTVTDPVAGSSVYQINDFYLNGNKKRTAQAIMNKRMVYEGPYVTWYKNGNQQQRGNYVNDELEGEQHTYYPDGKLYVTKVYSKEGTPAQQSVYIKTVKDLKGKNLVRNGNGKYVIYDEDFKQVTDQGNVKEGLNDGLWTGKNLKRQFSYAESYDKGKFLSGKSTDEKGKIYAYTKLVTDPEFVGGHAALSKFLGTHIRYPEKCQEAGIEGTVFLKFTVLKTGEIRNISVLKSIHPDLNAEALRVVRLFAPWKPGYYRGIAEDTFCNLPVRFVLSN
ncbi:energy transducer TonB [Pedobacter sp. KBW06]|uniref:energy transducer TonB n=1 Tax=Pedobacter sp. KBW06 TaxID=2153359 RepID=UPI0013156587|nr:energy transducer TonB [Pedobacter sp. KBW06]